MMQKPYPVYKDSGVEWIGEIPSNWVKTKISYLFRDIGSGGTPNTKNDGYYLNGTIPWINTGDLNDGYLSTVKNRVTELALQDISTLKVYPEDSLIVAMYGATIGKLSITKISAVTNQACCVLAKPKNTSNRYMYYWFLANRTNIIQLASGGGQPNISQNIIKSLRVYLPECKKEQNKIVVFLDKKARELNDVIQSKKAQIKLLEEKRQAVITEAVTKGLDPNVTMKDSGVEWIGEIPAHWEALAIKRLTQVKRGASPRPIDDPNFFSEDGSYSWVRISDVTNSEKYLLTTKEKLSDLGSEYSVKLLPGALFVSIAGTVGKPCITKINCCIHDGFVYFPDYRENKEFLFYIFSSGQPYLGLGKMGTQLNLNTETIGSIKIPLPSIDEQNNIVEFIVAFDRKINSIKQTLNTQIQKLKDYRESLIYEAVTGKIDLRDYKGGEYDGD